MESEAYLRSPNRIRKINLQNRTYFFDSSGSEILLIQPQI